MVMIWSPTTSHSGSHCPLLRGCFYSALHITDMRSSVRYPRNTSVQALPLFDTPSACLYFPTAPIRHCTPTPVGNPAHHAPVLAPLNAKFQPSPPRFCPPSCFREPSNVPAPSLAQPSASGSNASHILSLSHTSSPSLPDSLCYWLAPLCTPVDGSQGNVTHSYRPHCLYRIEEAGSHRSLVKLHHWPKAETKLRFSPLPTKFQCQAQPSGSARPNGLPAAPPRPT